MINIPHIQLKFSYPCDIVTSVYLCPPNDSRAHLMTTSLFLLYFTWFIANQSLAITSVVASDANAPHRCHRHRFSNDFITSTYFCVPTARVRFLRINSRPLRPNCSQRDLSWYRSRIACLKASLSPALVNMPH